MTTRISALHDQSDPAAAYREAAAVPVSAAPKRKAWASMWKGLWGKCPECGEGAIFGKYLKVNATCSNCGCEFHHHRADDAPPYLTIFIVGHLIVPLMLVLERAYAPDVWVHWSIWIPSAIVLSLVLLPMMKGALIALQWALRMHGFGHAGAD